MPTKKDRKPGKVAGKVIRKQLKGVKSDVKGVKSGVAKQVKSVKSDVQAVKTGVAKQTKAVKSATKAAKAVNKGVSKEVKAVKSDVKNVKENVSKGNKRLSKSLQKSTKKLSTQSTQIKEELDKLTAAVGALKKGKPVKNVEKRELSMYNLFVRKQIQQGKTFNEAVRAWPRYRNLIDNPNLSAPKTKTRTRTITKTKTVVKRIPVVKTKTIVKRVKVKDNASTKQLEELKQQILSSVNKNNSMGEVRRELLAIKDELHDLEKNAAKTAFSPASAIQRSKTIQETKSTSTNSSINSTNVQKVMEMMSDKMPDEQVAAQLVKLYFEEIARLGFKRSLDFDSIINAYFYCLQRLKHKEKELEVMRKLVEKEESKLTSESKSQLFPAMEKQ